MTTTSDRPWSDGPGPGAPSAATRGDDTKEVAQEQAAQVKDRATEAGQQVVDTAKDQAIDVATDAKAQAVHLLDRARGELGTQASAQKDRAVQGLKSLATQLQSMAESGGEQSGAATRLARQGSQTSEQVAGFLAERDPSQLVEEIRGFARRRPAAFLVGAAMAGIVAGRLTRGVKSTSESAQAAPHTEPAVPGPVA
jgi:hypothetical protein